VIVSVRRTAKEASSAKPDFAGAPAKFGVQGNGLRQDERMAFAVYQLAGIHAERGVSAERTCSASFRFPETRGKSLRS
jgi:hypothetical protein